MTKATLVVLLAVALVAAACGAAATGQNSSAPQSPNIAATVPPPPAGQPAGTAASPAGHAVYAPPKLQDAPANIRDFVILGGGILTDTQKLLAGTVGNKLNCSNCHFEGGITQGGKNGGISLVGVGAKYPAFTSRHNGPTDLSLRTFD